MAVFGLAMVTDGFIPVSVVTSAPPLEFIVPWNDDAKTLMLRAMTFCVPEVALRCWIALSTRQGVIMPRMPQPQTFGPLPR